MTPSSPLPALAREVNLREATALNIIDMIGVGPFVTIPLIIHAMHGPQAMLGWILGAGLAMCDGLVWAELGASMPQAGGSYQYLKESYGAKRLGRLMSFLFVWQLIFSAPLSIASGCLGIARYAEFVWPSLAHVVADHTVSLGLGPMGALEFRLFITHGTFVAMGSCLLALWLLYRRVSVIGQLARYLSVGVLGAILLVIVAGLTHFSTARAFTFAPGAFNFSSGFITGLGAAMLVATYDYWGYYNVCFLGVLPWQELDQIGANEARYYIASTLLQRTIGTWWGMFGTFLIMWTAFASVFSLMLGYSRVPYVAAEDGNFFRAYAKLHPKHQFPHRSLLTLGLVTTAFCMLRLQDLIAALVVIRIMVQFLMQVFWLLLLRARHPEFPRPFRMYFYPIPALLAALGFIYVLYARPNLKEIKFGIGIAFVGIILFLARSWQRNEWPFSRRPAHDPAGEAVQ